MKRLLALFTAGLGSAAALGAGAAAAAPACKPVVGSFQAAAVAPGQGHCPAAAPFCTAGRVWGGLRGSYQFTMSGLTPSAPLGGVPTIVFFAGNSKVFLDGGSDEVFGVDTGSLDLPPGQGGFASLITFGGGTGAMQVARGQIRLRGEFNPADGTTTGDYLGVLCTG